MTTKRQADSNASADPRFAAWRGEYESVQAVKDDIRAGLAGDRDNAVSLDDFALAVSQRIAADRG